MNNDLTHSFKLGMTVPVYLFYGEEMLAIEQVLAELAALVAPENTDWSRELLRGDECSPDEVVETAQIRGLFGGRKLVVVRNALWLKPKKEKEEAETASAAPVGREKGKEKDKDPLARLLTYVQDPNPDTVLVLIAPGSVSRNSRIYKAVQKNGRVAEFAMMKGAERESWLRDYLRTAGKRPAPDVCSFIAMASAEGLAALKAEVDKLLLYCYDKTEITLADAEAIVSQSALAGVFDLTDRVAEKNAPEAAAILRRLLRQGEPAPRLLATLANQYRSILLCKDMTQQGFSPQQIVTKAGMNPYYAKKCVAQGRHYGLRALLRALDILLAADWDSKSGKGDMDVLLELAVLRLCAL